MGMTLQKRTRLAKVAYLHKVFFANNQVSKLIVQMKDAAAMQKKQALRCLLQHEYLLKER